MDPALAESLEDSSEAFGSKGAFESTFFEDLLFAENDDDLNPPSLNPGYVLLIFVAAVAVLFCAKIICSEDRSYIISIKTHERSIASVTGSAYTGTTPTSPQSQPMETNDVVFDINDEHNIAKCTVTATNVSAQDEETSDESEISEPEPRELSTIYEE